MIEEYKLLKKKIEDFSSLYQAPLPILVAVSKKQEVDKIRKLYEFTGHVDFGENYWQEFELKKESLKNLPLKWHFIGQIQSNKFNKINENADYIHSIDQTKYIPKLKKKYFIQANLFKETQKAGLNFNEIIELFKKEKNFEFCLGFMLMGPSYEISSDILFETFSNFKNLIKEHHLPSNLSVGMSQDYEIAIKLHTNYLRIGSAIFGKRN